MNCTMVARRVLFTFVFQIFVVSVLCQSNPNYMLRSVVSRVLVNFQKPNDAGNASFHLDSVIRSLQPESIINYSARKDRYNVIQRNATDQEQCDSQFVKFLVGVARKELWALKMLDSSSKIPSGILIGNIRDIGVYDECVSVKVTKANETIRGRHCMYSLAAKGQSADAPIAPTLSICLPSACDAGDVTELLQGAVDYASEFFKVDVRIQSVVSTAVEPEPWTAGDIIAVSTLCIFIGFVVICTIYDIAMRATGSQERNNVGRELRKFSMYTNGQRVLDMKVPKSHLPSIQGIRFFSMCWVILGHEYFLQTMGVIINGADIPTWLSSWSALYILIAPFTVDTFFVISGFLTSYLFLKEMMKGRKFNPLMYYVHRYFRLTPALGALLLLTIFVFPRIGSGAMWEANMKMQEDMCSHNWWAMLLYVHNYVNTEDIMCLGHTWYLAVDMQFFWISPLILYPLSRKPKVGLSILGVFLVASVIIPAVISAEYKYSGALFTSIDINEIMDMMIHFYITSYTRAGPWLLGVYLGYILAKKQNLPSINFVAFGWSLAVAAFAFIFFSYRVFQADGYKYNVYWEVVYSGLSRHIWAFAVCWVIYTSITGYAGALSEFLSLPIFMPFGRISYCIYLVHFIIQLMKVSAIRSPFYFSDLGVLNLFLSDLILCTLGGFIFSLLFESPFLIIEKMVLGRKEKIQTHGSRDELRSNEEAMGADNQTQSHDESHSDLTEK